MGSYCYFIYGRREDESQMRKDEKENRDRCQITTMSLLPQIEISSPILAYTPSVKSYVSFFSRFPQLGIFL